MKVLLDTNVVFDVIEHRQPHYSASLQVILMARRNVVQAAMASHTVANIFYRYRHKAVPTLRDRFLPYIEISSGDAYLVTASLSWGFSDLEDALQAAAAMSWKASFIVTRNTRDFARSPVPALSPCDFLRRFLK